MKPVTSIQIRQGYQSSVYLMRVEGEPLENTCTGSLSDLLRAADRIGKTRRSIVLVIGNDGELRRAIEYLPAEELLEDGLQALNTIANGRKIHYPVETDPASFHL